MEEPWDEAGHQRTGINDNNICNILSDHWLTHTDASEINVSSISTHNGRLNTYGGALLNTHKRKRSLSSIALTFIRTPTTQQRKSIRAFMEERQADYTVDCCPACRHLRKQKSAAERQKPAFRPLVGKKKKKKKAGKRAGGSLKCTAAAAAAMLSKCNFSSRCN